VVALRAIGRIPPAILPLGLLLAALLLVPLGGCAAAVQADTLGVSEQAQTRVGPANGALVLAGGGALGPDIWERFVELAGGPDAAIVVIPTAGGQDEYPDSWSGLEGLRAAGVRNLTVLHTRNRAEADSDAFVDVLIRADGVWIPGGRQWRLVDAYLGTRVHQELFRVLERGGVVGGTSAGASIQASFLVRGDPETNQVVVSEDYEQGFGLLSGAAVDQHLLVRSREEDLWKVLDLHPDLLGIGLDEGTALVVQGNRAEVIGRSQALIYDPNSPLREAVILHRGDLFDLAERAPIPVAVEDLTEDHDDRPLDSGP